MAWEKQMLQIALSSAVPELVAICGRRRVSKTFLVQTVSHKDLIFEFSGAHEVTWGLLQMWLDGRTIGRFAKPNFSPGRKSNSEQQIVTSANIFNHQRYWRTEYEFQTCCKSWSLAATAKHKLYYGTSE